MRAMVTCIVGAEVWWFVHDGFRMQGADQCFSASVGIIHYAIWYVYIYRGIYIYVCILYMYIYI